MLEQMKAATAKRLVELVTSVNAAVEAVGRFLSKKGGWCPAREQQASYMRPRCTPKIDGE